MTAQRCGLRGGGTIGCAAIPPPSCNLVSLGSQAELLATTLRKNSHANGDVGTYGAFRMRLSLESLCHGRWALELALARASVVCPWQSRWSDSESAPRAEVCVWRQSKKISGGSRLNFAQQLSSIVIDSYSSGTMKQKYGGALATREVAARHEIHTLGVACHCPTAALIRPLAPCESLFWMGGKLC